MHEMDFLLQAKDRQQEEHFRKLDALIRQQQANRKESAKANPIMKLRKNLYINPRMEFYIYFTAAAVHFQNVCTAASMLAGQFRSDRSSASQ